MILHYVDLSDGSLIDTITLGEDGALHYATGDAREMVEGWARRNPELDPAGVLGLLTGWSNGYVVMRPAAPAE